MSELRGQSVVITGSGGGLGAAYAKAAAAIGANTVINDINTEAAEAVAGEIRAAGGKAVAHVCDIVDPSGAQTLVDRCIAEYGEINGLVNNAGLFFTAPIAEARLDHLRRMLEVNVIGTFNCGQAAVRHMLRRGGGTIVNITSGAHAGMPAHGSYGASKGAVASFTYNWACDVEGTGVRVNALSPLAFTPMAAHLPHLPPVEVNVPALLYLLSDRSSGLNGQILRITGAKLSLMTHPANRAPVLERDKWTLESVAAAFDGTLTALALPNGVATYEICAIHE